MGYSLTLTRLYEIAANGGRLHLLKVLKDSDHSWPPEPPPPDCDVEDFDPDSHKVPHDVALVNAKTGRRLKMQVTKDSDEDPVGYVISGPGGSLVYQAYYHNTEIKKDSLFYLLNPKTGTLRRLTDGNALIWSPDGSRFCLIPSPRLIPYEKRREPYKAYKNDTSWDKIRNKYLIVESVSLYVRAVGGGKMQQLTPILSCVDGADWRKAK